MEFKYLCDEDTIPVGEKKPFTIDGESILLFHLEDGFYATQNRCPHMLASLAKGKIINKTIIQCRIHKSQFNIKTGKVIKWAHFPPGIQALNIIRSAHDLKTYQTKVEDKKIYIKE